MLLTCPNCETIFRVDSQSIRAEGQTVRCSVCSHVWFTLPPNSSARTAKRGTGAGKTWKLVRVPLICGIVLAGLLAGAISQRVILTAYLPGLIPTFDVVGLTIRPQIDRLEVVDLQADHAGDNLRLRGQLRNTSGVRTHAADLLVTVTGPNGTVLNEKVLKPDDRFIEPGAATPFFAQMTVEKSDEATITVVPIGSRIYQ